MPDLILPEATRTALWHDLVRDAEKRAGNALSEDAEAYLVFTLIRLTEDTALAERVLALDLLQGLCEAGSRRAEQLRDTGDRCLLIAGLYPEQARRRAVSLGYYCDLGVAAYRELSAAVRRQMAALYAHVAEAFRVLVRVLIELRKWSGDWAGLDPMGRFELLQTGQGIDALAAAREFPGAILLPQTAHA